MVSYLNFDLMEYFSKSKTSNTGDYWAGSVTDYDDFLTLTSHSDSHNSKAEIDEAEQVVVSIATM